MKRTILGAALAAPLAFSLACPNIALGASGTPTQTSVTVGTSSTTLNSTVFSYFAKVCVPISAANGIWVNWAGSAAVEAAPSEYIMPGQCDSWVKSNGFLPTSTWHAIASASVAVTVMGN